MAIETQDTTFKTPSGQEIRAFRAWPQGAKGAPGVIVIHEIWGVDKHIRNVAERLAEAGYSAIAPDLLGMDVTIAKETMMAAFGAVSKLAPEDRAVPAKVDQALEAVPADQRDQVKQLMAIAWQGARPQGLEAMGAAGDLLRSDGSAKIGVTGFCLGGGYTWAFAYSGGNAEAFAPFYGRLPEARDASRVKGAIEGHFGSEDHGIPVPPLLEATRELQQAGKEATIHVYDGAGHAFFNDTRDTYNKDAAQLAWRRLLDFFERKLGRVPIAR